jgi:hypothetical protein
MSTSTHNTAELAECVPEHFINQIRQELKEGDDLLAENGRLRREIQDLQLCRNQLLSAEAMHTQVINTQKDLIKALGSGEVTPSRVEAQIPPASPIISPTSPCIARADVFEIQSLALPEPAYPSDPYSPQLPPASG